MDPNVALEEMRRLSEKSKLNFLTDDEIDRFSELFDSLDTWLTQGGFKPTSWQDDKVPCCAHCGCPAGVWGNGHPADEPCDFCAEAEHEG